MRGKVYRLEPGVWQYECLDYNDDGGLVVVVFEGTAPTWEQAYSTVGPWLVSR